MKQNFSRRELLKASSFGLLPPLAATFPPLASAAGPSRILAYIGTYSSPQGPEGGKGHGKGIYVFSLDPATGRLSNPQLCRDDMNPSWLAIHPSGKYLYAANEISTFDERQTGAVTAYAIEPRSGNLSRLNTVSSGSAGAAHLSVHPSGRYVLAANYLGGAFAVIPVHADGRLAAPTDVKQGSQSSTGAQASSAPPGSFAVSGHDHAHAHMIETDPSGNFVVGSDLGTDTIYTWRLDLETGKLNPASSIAVPAGDGPRHFVFHPNGRWLYSLQEEASTLILFEFDPAQGTLKSRNQVSTLPAGFAGTNFTSEVRIAKDGKFLYAANRLHDSISVFSIGGEGELSFASETWTRGDYPRSFSIDPGGNFLYCCNQRSDAVTCFRVDRSSGALTFTDHYTAVGTPSVVVFRTA